MRRYHPLDAFTRTQSRLFLWAGLLLALLLAGPDCSVDAADDTAKAPEKQQESDWVDARWDRVDLGNFHASSLPLPNGTLAKGLSVRIGKGGEAAVAYDTASASLRAAWTGGFLKFNGSRYGLIQFPKPNGALRFLAPAGPGWGNAPVRWRGLHVHGPRVVAEYEVAGATVQESPWFDSPDGMPIFSRMLGIRNQAQALAVSLLEGKGREFSTKTVDGHTIVTLTGASNVLFATVLGEAGADLRFAGGVLKLHLPALPQPRRLRIIIAEGRPADAPAFAAQIQTLAPAEDLTALAQPGPARWRPLPARGQRGFGSDAYVIDTLSVPYDNPWKALFFTSGVDFLPNGDAAVCTIHGDVWLVTGIDDTLQKLTWRRFATGLFQPLGLRVRDGKIFVLGRDQITRLHDDNGDGEADFYESFFNEIKTSTGGHDYVTSLEADTNGNFYYIDPRGLHRVSPSGATSETVASGWRNPNGMGASPDGGILLTAPQQGEWTPSSAICEARPGGYYGYGGPKISRERPLGYDPPLCWIPHSVDNSGGSQLWVASDKWGPLNGHFLHFSFGRCSHFLVLRDVVDGIAQGAVVSLPGRFLSGAMRGAFSPHDGQLYVVGCRGWQTSAARDGCLQRVRYTGRIPLIPVAMNIHSNGLRLEFSKALDRAAAEDPGSYALAQWNYRYAARYGSQDYSVVAPDREGHDVLEIHSAKLLPDGRSIFLEVPSLGPVMQWELKFNLSATDGRTERGQLYGSIHRLAPAWTP